MGARSLLVNQATREQSMAQTAIFGPFFATMLLTLLVWVYMYIRRISFIKKNNISPKDLAVPGALAQLSPAAVSNPSDNLKNLFEIPVLFYALALYLFVTAQVDATYVSAAFARTGRYAWAGIPYEYGRLGRFVMEEQSVLRWGGLAGILGGIIFIV